MSIDKARLYNRPLNAEEVAASASGNNLFITETDALQAMNADQKKQHAALNQTLKQAQDILQKLPPKKEVGKIQQNARQQFDNVMRKKLRGNTFTRMPVENPRYGGIITSAAMLSMNNGTKRTHPIARSAWIIEVIFNDPRPRRPMTCRRSMRMPARRTLPSVRSLPSTAKIPTALVAILASIRWGLRWRISTSPAGGVTSIPMAATWTPAARSCANIPSLIRRSLSNQSCRKTNALQKPLPPIYCALPSPANSPRRRPHRGSDRREHRQGQFQTPPHHSRSDPQ